MSKRLPQTAFGLLVLATIGAFFLVQTLKTAPPFLWIIPTPIPSTFNPIHGRRCVSPRTGKVLNYRQTTLTFSVSHADTVGVYIVSAQNPNGNTIATVSSGTPMLAAPGADKDTEQFTWNGRMADGQFAPDGEYYFRIVLYKEDRSFNLSKRPVLVKTRPPDPKILGVRVLAPGRGGKGHGNTTTTGTTTGASSGTTTGGAGATTGSTGAGGTTTGAGEHSGHPSVPSGPAVFSPPRGELRITFKPGTYRRVWIDIYRTDVAGGPELAAPPLPVTNPRRDWTIWNGEIDGVPVPAGTYLVGITAQDLACNKGQWPVVVPQVAGITAHAGVTIRYLSVTPPLTPTVSGGHAAVAVDSPAARFSWVLRRSGSTRVAGRGSGKAGASNVRVRMPRHIPGLYTLDVSAGAQSAAVPLVASQAGRAAAQARVLVVLPVLDWMGDTPVDDSGDGLPDTLRAGDGVSLARPLVDGLPAGFGEDVALLQYLRASHLAYQLTTDVALAEGRGPSLADRGGVVFPAGEDYLPATLRTTLRGFVRSGGRVLALGTGTFSGTSHISGFPAAPRASAPLVTIADPFGAERGPMTPTGGQEISELSDALNLFAGATVFSGFGDYQPIRPSSSAARGPVSTAGIGSGGSAIVAFRYGSGTVVEVGLPGFAGSLAHNSDSEELLNHAWQLLSQ